MSRESPRMDVDLSDPRLGQARDAMACGNCGRMLTRLPLTGHYGRDVDLDLCASCHLVWFDAVESARLPGSALLTLLATMARLQAEPHQVLSQRACCPRCLGSLKRVSNRSRWGPTLQLECLNGHGAWQTFAQFLSEKGLIRTLSSADRARLIAANAALACLNCGAPIGSADTACGHCESIPGLVDVARMARALDPEGAVENLESQRIGARRHAFNCHACGAAVDKMPSLSCAQCGATLACTGLREAHDALKGLEPALLQHQMRPGAKVVARRLKALGVDLPRRRDWVHAMKADAKTPIEAEGRFWAWLIGWLVRRLH